LNGLDLDKEYEKFYKKKVELTPDMMVVNDDPVLK
jgi:hypothetical protein